MGAVWAVPHHRGAGGMEQPHLARSHEQPWNRTLEGLQPRRHADHRVFVSARGTVLYSNAALLVAASPAKRPPN
jgi:hypothetical protein